MFTLLLIIVVVAVVVLSGMAIEIWRTPAGIERERTVENGRITSRTRTVTSASADEAIRLLQTDWSWWDRARAEPMQDLGDGRKAFTFHPIRFLNLIASPPVIGVRFERTEPLAGGGACIHATITGDFDGRAEYSARPGNGGTILELAWVDAEVRSILRFAPIALAGAVHCWRERIGVAGLRRRLESGRH